MDGVLGAVDVGISYRKQSPRVLSHGRWPVKKLVEGQTIRFRSHNYENVVVMKIRSLRWFDQMVIVSGSGANDVAFGLQEYVELVSVEEAD